MQESRLKLYGNTYIEKRKRICGQSDDGGAGEKNERKTEAEVVG